MAEPILKWAGGKRQILPELKTRFPKQYNTYHEPMIGAGALYFNIQPPNGTINDINPRLTNFYKQVKNNHIRLLNKLRSFKDPESKPDPQKEFSETTRKGEKIENYYYQQRELFNRRPNKEEFGDLEEASLLLYLNRTCFNGLYRENEKGEFNVPIGRYSNPDWVREKQIKKVSKVLNDTEILNQGFEYILEYAEEGDLVYFDPPYEPMSNTADFTSYSQDGFGKEEQEQLLEVAQRLSEKGVYVILSNSGVMYDKYNESGFFIDKVGAKRAINSDAENRGEVDEIIATNIPSDKRKQKSIESY